MADTVKGVEIDPVREKLVELKKVLRECLHFNYDEFSCDMSLDVDLTAENLIAHGVTVQEWISVKDRLPEADAGKVLCITQAGHYKILQWIETFDCWSDPFGIDFTNFRNGYITHWMPLPQPPKGE